MARKRSMASYSAGGQRVLARMNSMLPHLSPGEQGAAGGRALCRAGSWAKCLL